jgi:hypothetical protein
MNEGSKYRMKQLLHAWFSLREPVSRAEYLVGGLLFMLLKYAIERALFLAWVGRALTPVAFLSPFFVDRAALLRGAPDGATWTMIGLALPFLWIGVSMSVRRTLDAGLPPMLGFLFLIPGVSYLLMLGLCVVPTRRPLPLDTAASAYRPAPEQAAAVREVPSNALRITRAILSSAAVGLGMFGVCVYLLRSYGAALFIATPFVMGMVAVLSYRGAPAPTPAPAAPPRGLQARQAGDPTKRVAVGCGLAAIALVGIVLLFGGMEGLACLGMALVPALLLAPLGAVLAIEIGKLREVSNRGSHALLLALPLAAGGEAAIQRAPLHEVVTTIVVDAPPEVVWRYVTSGPDLDPPTEWIFHKGIAYPVRARIDGEGVGATRYCDFSTGTFVEPVTRWEVARRLSFDVAESPVPMREWSFWDGFDAPHLHGFMRSKGGEFRLVPLPGGKTRLEGSSFYELEVFPELYWKVWTDGIAHAIHGRVLRHIKRLSEAEAHAPAHRDGDGVAP